MTNDSFGSQRVRAWAAVLAVLGAAAALLLVSSAQFASGPAGLHRDLALWLKADMGVVAGAGAVEEWMDLSGNKRHASQLDSSFRPAASTLRGTPAVLFGQGTCLSIEGAFLVDTDYTIIVVDARRGSLPLNYYLGGDSLLPTRNLVLGYADPETLRMTDLAADLDADVEVAPVETVVWSAFILDSRVGRKLFWKGGEVERDGSRSQLTAFTGATIGRVPA